MKTRYGSLVARYVTPLLREAGFRKKGAEYFRARESFSHLVSMQTSQWNDDNGFRFTRNCGVLVPGVMEVYANKKAGSPRIEDCSFSTRVGFLTSQRKDLWWALNESVQETDSAIGQDIADELRELVLPFLDQFNTTRDVVSFLTDPNSNKLALPRSRAQRFAYAAIVTAKGGRASHAKELIACAKEEAVGSPIEMTINRVKKKLDAR